MSAQLLPLALTAFGRKRTQGLTGEAGSLMVGQQEASPDRGMETARHGGASAWAPAGL